MMDIVTNEPMKLLMENLSDMAIEIHKGMKFAVETEMPGQVVQLEDHWNLNPIFKVRVGEYFVFEIQVDGTIKKTLEEPTDCK